MRYIYLSFFVFSFFAIFVIPVYAAVIKIDSDFSSLNVGDIFTVSILADTENQIVNAVDTEISFPSEMLEYVSADDGESLVSLWVQKPAYDGFSSIAFSGIAPGGFSSNNANLLILKFKAIKAGQGNIEMNTAKLLLHDGLGTEASLTKQNLHITINNNDSQIVVNTIDDEMPESFNPEIIQDPDVYEGANTLIFSAKDKGSGIDRYEVKEGWFSRFQIADSPYKIKNQNLDEKIQVKAIDKVGNERLEIIYPQNYQPINERSGIIVSIIALCVIALYILRRFRSGSLLK